MKLTLALLTLLPALGTASCIASRDEGALPTVDILSLSDDLYALAGVSAGNETETESGNGNGNGISTRQSCPSNYPWYCRGRCCPYSRCCASECCGTRATFCGASDGRCYFYT
ncbi:hypothetical protein GGS20DRAFT_528146 [Poronia punctata]|nr:hypothetical protein GGS20DRAFT_528146 [Poronia punctata]